MTFDSREKSRYSGQPVECYRFAMGSTLWLFTSADQAVVLPSGTYEPNTLQRGELDHSQEDQAGSLEISVPRDHPIAVLFIPGAPPSTVSLTVYRAHRGELTDPAVIFMGSVAGVSFTGSEAKLICLPISQILKRRMPALGFQTQCNWALYSPGCGVARASFRDVVTLSAVNGVAINSADFAMQPDGWYENGWLETPAGEVRFIVSHVSNLVMLVSALTSLAAGQTAYVFAGCDRTETACRTKFNNIVNHMGFARIPTRNPHDGSIA